MKDKDKTKNELISELIELRNRLSRSERSEAHSGIAKKKLSEEKENMYRAFYQQAPMACFSVDSGGHIKMANKTATDFLGYPLRELIDRQMLDLYADISIKKAGEVLTLANSGKEIHGEELEMRRVDGSQIHVRVWIKPFWDRGRVMGSLCVVIDVTHLRLAQEELALSEQNFRNSLDNSPLGIRIVNADEELLYANQAILDIYGYNSIEELEGIPAKERYTRESYAEHRARIRRRKRGEIINSYEISIVRKDEEIRHVSVSRNAVVWNGEPQFMETYQDITERKLAEKTLKESEAKQRLILDNINDTVFQLSPTGIIQYVSSTAGNIYGYPEEDLIGKHIKKTTPASELPKALKAIKDVLLGKEVNNLEINQFDVHGRIIPVEINATPVREDSNIVAVEGVMRDITERKRADKAIRESEDKFHSLYTEMSEGVCLYEILHDKSNNAIDYVILDVNPAF